MWINTTTCKNAFSEVASGRLALIRNDLATSFRCFINDSTSPFWVWTSTGCSTSISIDMQHSWKAWDVNSSVLARQIYLIG